MAVAVASLFLTVGKMYVAAFATFACLYFGYKSYKRWRGFVKRERENEHKNKERKNEGRLTPTIKDRVPDIEDFGKSLIPKTLKQMKADGLTPYTVQERKEKKETKHQPSMLPGPDVPGCCFVSFHILWAILSTSTVETEADVDPRRVILSLSIAR